jgi:hypothetical protein
MKGNNMRDFRIRTENADRLLLALQDLGYEAFYSKCRPKTTWGNGCSNPNCCQQHPEAIIKECPETGAKIAYMPETWTAISTTAGSNTVHAVLKAMSEESIK